MELTLLRHTRVAESDRCYGHSDPPLAASFPAEVDALKRELRGRHFDRVISSPSQRCRALCRALALTPTYDPRLQELAFGAWEGQRWADLPRPTLDAWAANWCEGRPPGGESFRDQVMRCAAAVADWPAAACLLIIAHAGTIRALLVHLLDLPLDRAFAFSIEPGGQVQLDDHRGAWRLTRLARGALES